jgi:hypothetical protein
MPRIAPKVMAPRTSNAQLDETADGLLMRLGIAGNVPVAESERGAANRLVLLGYAARVPNKERIKITPTGRAKLGRRSA